MALEDLSVAVVELETGRVVRRLAGHDGRLTDVAFSPDARWLVSSSQDGAIRTWDLPTGSYVPSTFSLSVFSTTLMDFDPWWQVRRPFPLDQGVYVADVRPQRRLPGHVTRRRPGRLPVEQQVALRSGLVARHRRRPPGPSGAAARNGLAGSADRRRRRIAAVRHRRRRCRRVHVARANRRLARHVVPPTRIALEELARPGHHQGSSLSTVNPLPFSSQVLCRIKESKNTTADWLVAHF